MPNEYIEIFGNPFVFGSTSYEFDCAMIDNEFQLGMKSYSTLNSDAWHDYVATYCMMSV